MTESSVSTENQQTESVSTENQQTESSIYREPTD